MSLSDEERTIIVGLEIKKASETFEEIEILVAAKRWSGAASRLYYAVFHAVNALLIKDGHMVSSHKGSHGAFGQYYVTTGVFPPEYGRLYNQLQSLREQSDYNCVYNVSEEDVCKMIQPAQNLISDIKQYLATK